MGCGGCQLATGWSNSGCSLTPGFLTGGSPCLNCSSQAWGWAAWLSPGTGEFNVRFSPDGVGCRTPGVSEVVNEGREKKIRSYNKSQISVLIYMNVIITKVHMK